MKPQVLNQNITVYKDANTAQIMQALIAAVPGASKNLIPFKNKNFAGDEQDYLKKIVKYLRENVTYKKDDFLNQNIKYPGRIIQEKTGDCKSLSLYAAGALTAANIPNGFRFVSYKKNGEPTHVYNYYYDKNGNKIIFDLCTKDLKQTNFSNSIDMDVNYLAGPEIGKGGLKNLFNKLKDKVQDTFQDVKGNVQNTVQTVKDKREQKGKPKIFKKFALATPRAAALILIGSNFRDLASKIAEAERKEPGKVQAFFKRVGGNPAKLMKAVDRGKNKRPLLGAPGMGDGEAADAEGLNPQEIAQTVGAASSILAPLLELLKKILGKKGEDKELEKSKGFDFANKLPPGFAVSDPEPGTEAASAGDAGNSYAGGASAGELLKNPLVIVGGLGLLYVLTKKK